MATAEEYEKVIREFKKSIQQKAEAGQALQKKVDRLTWLLGDYLQHGPPGFDPDYMSDWTELVKKELGNLIPARGCD